MSILYCYLSHNDLHLSFQTNFRKNNSNHLSNCLSFNTLLSCLDRFKVWRVSRLGISSSLTSHLSYVLIRPTNSHRQRLTLTTWNHPLYLALTCGSSRWSLGLAPPERESLLLILSRRNLQGKGSEIIWKRWWVVIQSSLSFGAESEVTQDNPKNLINNWITLNYSYVKMVVFTGGGFEEGWRFFDDVLGYIKIRGHIEGWMCLFSEHGLTDSASSNWKSII